MTWVPSSESKYVLRPGCACRPCNQAREHMETCSTRLYRCPHVTTEHAALAAFLPGRSSISRSYRVSPWWAIAPSMYRRLVASVTDT